MEQDTKPRWYKSKLFEGGMGALDFGLTYADRRHTHPEENQLKSIGIAGASAAAWMYIPGIMWAKTALDVGKAAGGMMQNYRNQTWGDEFARIENRGVIGSGFQDTDIGYTARQRGMQAIQSSRLNARSALSNEARSLHRF